MDGRTEWGWRNLGTSTQCNKQDMSLKTHLKAFIKPSTFGVWSRNTLMQLLTCRKPKKKSRKKKSSKACQKWYHKQWSNFPGQGRASCCYASRSRMKTRSHENCCSGGSHTARVHPDKKNAVLLSEVVKQFWGRKNLAPNTKVVESDEVGHYSPNNRKR